jgi:DNA polymerase-3 subunit delta'
LASSLIGNARAVGAVQRALARGSPPHAWLFAGPAGVGKAALAGWVAQAVNCERIVGAKGGVGAQGLAPLRSADGEAPAPKPCGECAQCSRIARGIHADVVTISVPPPEDGVQHKDISVEQVREVEQAVALAPFEGRTRVVIIDPADAMSGGAQNAFLKTLEEPPPNAVFILIATQPDDLLPTVRSRCRTIEFGLVSAADIEAALRERGKEEGEARLLARLAEGRPERAIALASDSKRLDKRRELLEEASALGGMALGDLMDLTERTSRQYREKREAVVDRLSAWVSWWRDVILIQGGAEDSVANIDLINTLRNDAAKYEHADVITFVQALLKCRERLEANVQARIALDAMIVLTPRTRETLTANS